MNTEEGNREQIRRMVLYRKKVSDTLGYDIGETGYYAWVEKYSGKFREWSESNKGTTGIKGTDFIED